jgi:methylglutaconyl-CoA hydratase
MNRLVALKRDGGVARITFNSPNNFNALGTTLLTDAIAHLERSLADPEVRVVVVGASGRFFSSGSDLKDVGPSAERLEALLEAVRTAPKPVIACIAGDAYGGALGLVAVCDLVVAADTAQFAFSEVRWGVAPTIAAVHCLSRLRPVDALEMFLTGEPFSAQRAHEAGLVTKVVPAKSLEREIDQLVEALMLGGPVALQLCKELCRTIPTLPRGEAQELVSRMTEELMSSAEAQEGLAAFAGKRSPGWANR